MPARADGMLEIVNETLREPIRLVAEWETNNTWAFTLVALVFLIGAVIAIIHSLPNQHHAKIGAVVLGSAVTLLTALSNAYFDFDHRQYKSMASQGRQLLSEIRALQLQMKDVPTDNRQARESLLQEIRGHRNAIMAIPAQFRSRDKGQDVATPARTAAWVPSWISTAHAQQTPAPAWVAQLPTDERNWYFVGYADGADFSQVKSASGERARQDARAFLGDRLARGGAGGVDAGAAALYLLESSRVAGTYSYFDAKLNAFRFYTLLAMNRQIVDSDLLFYAGKTQQRANAAQYAALKGASRSSSDYLSKRLSLYSQELDRAQAQLTADEFDRFAKGRKLRQEGRTREAAAELQAFTAARPDYYLGWFNLALTLDEMNDPSGARKAYERAISLEQKGSARDASLYNTFGYFLYRNKDYPSAISHLKAALEIAPDHPTARGTLKAAETAAASRAPSGPPAAPVQCQPSVGAC